MTELMQACRICPRSCGARKGKRERTRLLPYGRISQGSQSGPPFLGGALHQRNERIRYCVFQRMFPSVRLLSK